MQRSRRHLRSPDRRWRHQIAASLCWKEIATPLRGSQRRIATALPDLGMTIRNRSFVGAVTRLRDARLRIFLWEQAYKPGSVTGPLTLPSPPSRGARSMRSYQTATISLGRLLPDASCSLPGDAAGRLISPYVALHRAGFAQVSGHPEPRALLPHDCTLTDDPLTLPSPPHGGEEYEELPIGGMFLWHFPWGRPHWELPSALPFGVRTFLRRVVISGGRPACSRAYPCITADATQSRTNRT